MIEVGQLEVNYKPIQNIQQKKKKKKTYTKLDRLVPKICYLFIF
jgi:hypothetical protein